MNTHFEPDAQTEKRMLDRLLTEAEKQGYVRKDAQAAATAAKYQSQRQPSISAAPSIQKIRKPKGVPTMKITNILAGAAVFALVILGIAAIYLASGSQEDISGLTQPGELSRDGLSPEEFYEITDPYIDEWLHEIELPSDPEAPTDPADEATPATEPTEPPADPDPTPIPDAPDYTEVTVSTAIEFLNALDSNTMILLEEGVYNLTQAYEEFTNTKNVYFEDVFDGEEVRIKGLSNLTIQGVGDTPSEIVVEPRYADVLAFLSCTDISIINIEAGHTREKGYCTGGVFSFADSSGIRIENTNMYGCGTYGLMLSWTSDVRVTNSVIYECTYGIMQITDGADIRFTDCVFRDTEGFEQFSIYRSSDVRFDNCRFLRNGNSKYTEPDLFSADLQTSITVKNSLFAGNLTNKIGDSTTLNSITFYDSNTFENNTFETPPLTPTP